MRPIFLKKRLRASIPGSPSLCSIQRFTLVVLLLASLFSQSLFAQPPLRQELLPGLSTLKVDFNSRADFVDLDGDGDLDAAVGDNNFAPTYFENVGTASAPRFIERRDDANPIASLDVLRNAPEFVDLDADGDFDVILGEFDGGFFYFENTGQVTAPVFIERTGLDNPLVGVDVGDRSDPEVVDLDGDGDFDLVAGAEQGVFHYFENVGSPVSPAYTERTGNANPLSGITTGEDSAADLVDLDGDGDLDAIIGGEDGLLFYFQNVGTVQEPDFIQRVGRDNPMDGFDVGSSSIPEFVDLDDDGDLDLVVGDLLGGLAYFENIGTANAPMFVDSTQNDSPFGGPTFGVGEPETADLDGDGDLDLLLGLTNLLRLFENTGDSNNPVFVAWTGDEDPLDGVNFNSNQFPDLVDLDGDLDLDMVIGGGSGPMRYLVNTGDTSQPAFFELFGSNNPFDGIDVGFAASPELSDFDADGDLDAVVCEREGTCSYLENVGTPLEPTFVQRVGSDNPLDGIDLGLDPKLESIDLDRDGDIDLIAGEFNGFFIFLENIGNATSPNFQFLPGTEYRPEIGLRSSPEYADLDGDGDFDVLTGIVSGEFVFLRSLVAPPITFFVDGFESGSTDSWSNAVGLTGAGSPPDK